MAEAPASSESFEPKIAAPAALSAVMADLVAHTPTRRGAPGWKHGLRMAMTALLSSGFHMVLLYRIGAQLHRWRLRPLCIVIDKIIYH